MNDSSGAPTLFYNMKANIVMKSKARAVVGHFLGPRRVYPIHVGWNDDCSSSRHEEAGQDQRHCGATLRVARERRAKRDTVGIVRLPFTA